MERKTRFEVHLVYIAFCLEIVWASDFLQVKDHLGNQSTSITLLALRTCI